MPRDLPSRPTSGRNEPAFLPHVLAAIATHRQQAPEDVARATTENAVHFFGLDPSSDAASGG